VKPLFLAQLIDGTWHSLQTTKSFRGYEARFILWCRRPTLEQWEEVSPSLREDSHKKTALISELVGLTVSEMLSGPGPTPRFVRD
jgi:hypothetical protein